MLNRVEKGWMKWRKRRGGGGRSKRTNRKRKAKEAPPPPRRNELESQPACRKCSKKQMDTHTGRQAEPSLGISLSRHFPLSSTSPWFIISCARELPSSSVVYSRTHETPEDDEDGGAQCAGGKAGARQSFSGDNYHYRTKQMSTYAGRRRGPRRPKPAMPEWSRGGTFGLTGDLG